MSCVNLTVPHLAVVLRFEWYEIIGRTAVLKYGGGRETNDVSAAVQMLVDRNLQVGAAIP